MNYLPDFSKLLRPSFVVLCGIFICSLGLPAHGQAPGRDLAIRWGTFESDRIADWAAQLPAGEAQREGIIGSAIV
jgi:hypothetical protein